MRATRIIPRQKLGEMLLMAGKITRDELAKAITDQEEQGDRLGSALVRLGFLQEDELTRFLSSQQGTEAATIEDLEPDPAVFKLLPTDFVRRFEVVPVRASDTSLTVACTTPHNLALLDEVRFVTGYRDVRAVVAPEMAIRRVIDKHCSEHALLEEVIHDQGFLDSALKNLMADSGEHDAPLDVYQLEVDSEKPPVVSLVNYLLIEAIRRKASDIHVEPYEGFLRIRMRIDGMLHSVLTPPPRLHKALLSRIKIIGRMDISKTREPQDGHIAIEWLGEVAHYRVNTMPTVNGEKAVLRLLKKEEKLADFDGLGIPPKTLARLKREIAAPQGLILVTGPTGSGKTTTVHAALNSINGVETNVVTIEDPFEAAIPGVNHSQIDVKSGMTFISALRAILRQDPDVVFLGEIRDREVARTAMEAAMTGHMVFSTLHTNSAAESLVRLQDMGVEDYLIAGTLRAVLAQRLVRRVCPDCAVPVDPPLKELMELEVDQEMVQQARCREGSGCDACMHSGFRGRAGVYEAFFVTPEIKAAMRRGADVGELEAIAGRDGRRTMYDEGIQLVLDGVTTLEELKRVVSKL